MIAINSNLISVIAAMMIPAFMKFSPFTPADFLYLLMPISSANLFHLVAVGQQAINGCLNRATARLI